ncbi:MAG TPA: O-antigen ligase family protein [Thermodesulfobacteriota bacterium]|nr:O-antigen ligase family protein [Thermodesulfobacteriota bacterium]
MRGLHPIVTYGLVALLAFAPLVHGGVPLIPATVIRLAALVLATVWLWAALRPGGRWRIGTPVDVPVILLAVLAAASTVASVYPYASLHGFLHVATGAIVLALAAEVARERRGARWLAAAIAIGGVAQALLALAQAAVGGGRPVGTYYNPNFLATALVMAGALLLALRPPGRGWSAGRWTAFAAVGAGLVTTASRGGLLAAAAGWAWVAWQQWRLKSLAAAAVVAVGLVVVPNPLRDRLLVLDETDPRAYTRVQIWQSAIERTLANPFGVGLNLYRYSSQQYTFPVPGDLARYGRRPESAHSDYLQVLVELGPVGLGLVLWIVGALAVRARSSVRRADGAGDGPDRALRLGAAGALAGLAVHSLVDVPFQVPALVVQGAALAGLLLAEPAGVDRPARPGVASRLSGRWVRIAVAALVCVAAAGVARHGVAHALYERAAAVRARSGAAAAIPWLERAARLVPESAGYPDALASAAVAAWKATGDPEYAVTAERAMLKAIALDPEGARRWARLAVVYREILPADPKLRREALERARRAYEEAERIDPYAAILPYDRAGVLLALGDDEGAIAALRRAVALEPRYLAARLQLARLLAARGARAEALEQYAAIEETLARYPQRQADGPYVREFLAVDRLAVAREAAALRSGTP